MSNKPLFSVVTVCYNAGNLINKTIESVLAQKSGVSPGFSAHFDSLFEYIIQDGASTDDTLAVVESYRASFLEKSINIIVNSSKDNGIYDAMNRAVMKASGAYIIFMNADDCFYSDHVLSDVCKSLSGELNNIACKSIDNSDLSFSAGVEARTDIISQLPDIIYGDCIVKELGMYFKFRKCFDKIEERMPFSHQACFSKRELLLDSPLNTDYKITADYAFLLKSYIEGRTFFDSDVCIALVTADGLSSVHMLDTFVEVNKVCNDLSMPRFSESEYNKKLKEMKLKQFVLSYFPAFIKQIIRKSQLKKRGQITDVIVPVWCQTP